MYLELVVVVQSRHFVFYRLTPADEVGIAHLYPLNFLKIREKQKASDDSYHRKLFVKTEITPT
jgi:hypothetical protein